MLGQNDRFAQQTETAPPEEIPDDLSEPGPRPKGAGHPELSGGEGRTSLAKGERVSAPVLPLERDDRRRASNRGRYCRGWSPGSTVKVNLILAAYFYTR